MTLKQALIGILKVILFDIAILIFCNVYAIIATALWVNAFYTGP